MRSRTFQVKTTFRPGWRPIAALVAVLFAGLVVAIVGVGRYVALVQTCIWTVAIASWIVGMAMSRERPGAITIVDGVLTASWLRAPVRPSVVRIGRWVQMSLDTPVGIVAQVHGPGGSLRIGAREPLAAAYRLDGPRTQLVDCHLPAPEFDALVALLGVQPGPVAAGLTFELVPPRRPLRTMAPWLLTMVFTAVVGLGLSALAISPMAIGVVSVIILVGGLVATMLDWWRIREPIHELRLGSEGIALAEPSGQERQRAPWQAVRAVPTTGIMRMKGGPFVYPTLELTLGVATPIVVGAWDRSLAWTDPMERRRRTPDWLVGSADWPRLVGALESHGCFR